MSFTFACHNTDTDSTLIFCECCIWWPTVHTSLNMCKRQECTAHPNQWLPIHSLFHCTRHSQHHSNLHCTRGHTMCMQPPENTTTGQLLYHPWWKLTYVWIFLKYTLHCVWLTELTVWLPNKSLELSLNECPFVCSTFPNLKLNSLTMWKQTWILLQFLKDSEKFEFTGHFKSTFEHSVTGLGFLPLVLLRL